MTDWRDISCAPRDGTKIIAMVDGGEEFEAMWRDGWRRRRFGFYWGRVTGPFSTYTRPRYWKPLEAAEKSNVNQQP